ncbi:DUF4352 domain-containing protein [Rossellomorea marisflavi]|uniref:DUF4352 domain-containing protein n=1 Tax=Rossellomorea marisflavi TaxID=189381 RepID=UPI003D2E9DFD
MEEKKTNIIGLLSLVIGVIALITFFMPIVGLVTAVLSIAFGVISLVKKERTKWKAITGISVSFTAMVIATFVILISLIPDESISQDSRPDWAPEEVHKGGYLIEHGDVAISVDKVYSSSGKRVYPYLTIKNISGDTVRYSPNDFALLHDQGDNQGKRIDPVTDSGPKELDSGELEPGEEIKGEIHFEFPADHSYLLLVYKDELYIDVTNKSNL